MEQGSTMTDIHKTFGGFFPLELPMGEEYHSPALRLNSARYCLEYILRVRGYKKIYLPAYICDSVLQPIRRLHIDYSFYRIDEQFAPVLDKIPEDDDCLLYVNYFGLHRLNVRNISCSLNHVIIDNTQAFFELPESHIDTFYSPRKFFGVPDGGYLYTEAEKQLDLKTGTSYYLCDALLKQIDEGIEAAGALFEENETYLDTCGLLTMSRLTQRLLSGIDYPKAMNRRNKNFLFLHEQIGSYNQLRVDTGLLNGPMFYPFLTGRGEQLRDILLQQRIYTDSLWEEVTSRVPVSSFEYHLAENLIPLPIDQRYDTDDMHAISQIIHDFLG